MRLHKHFQEDCRYDYDGRQAGAPEGACHDNVETLGKNIIFFLRFF